MRTVPHRSSLALLLAVVAAFAAPAAASAADGQIIVKYTSGADARDRADARDDASVVSGASLPLDQTQLVTPERGTTVSRAVARLERSHHVVYAEPDRPRSAFATPNDPLFANQWALQNTGQRFSSTSGTAGDDIDAVPAWDIATEATPTVAVVASGVDLQHPDLKANILSGGYDFVGNDADPTDENGHGTHTAGTIGAVGNNGIGVAGVAWHVKIMGIKIYNEFADDSTSSMIINAFNYIRMMKNRGVNIRITNNSYGGCPEACGTDLALKDAIDALGDLGVLNVFAAGNSGTNNDVDPFFPASYDSPSIMSVGGSDQNDNRVFNYGANLVDIAAPGVVVKSTVPFALQP